MSGAGANGWLTTHRVNNKHCLVCLIAYDHLERLLLVINHAQIDCLILNISSSQPHDPPDFEIFTEDVFHKLFLPGKADFYG